MLSADPIINSIYSTQTYNRFSYVWNNPLKFVDPNGYDGKFAQWIKSLFKSHQTDCYKFSDHSQNRDRNRKGGGSPVAKGDRPSGGFGNWLKGVFGSSGAAFDLLKNSNRFVHLIASFSGWLLICG
jgi:hypothetical protein